MMKATTINPFSVSQSAATHTPYQGGTTEFDGQVTLQRLVTPEESSEVELLAVWFSAGARTRPHIHNVDQVLHIMEGQGIVADEKEMLTVNAGEVVTVPGARVRRWYSSRWTYSRIAAHAWHWHGATPESPVPDDCTQPTDSHRVHSSGKMHISIRKAGAKTDWEFEQKDWAQTYENWNK